MDFEKMLPLILQQFEQKNIRYAVIGGFAMGALGIMRTTMDLDFLVDAQDLPKIEKLMEQYNYRCIFKTENVSQYVSDIQVLGSIDFLHAFRSISVSMLSRTQEVAVLNNTSTMKVLCPEDIIGLKLQALVNDGTREHREYADIESIMEHYGETLNWSLIKEYFQLFDKKAAYDQLKGKYCHAQ